MSAAARRRRASGLVGVCVSFERTLRDVLNRLEERIVAQPVVLALAQFEDGSDRFSQRLLLDAPVGESHAREVLLERVVDLRTNQLIHGDDRSGISVDPGAAPGLVR